MSWTTPRTWALGETLTAALLNTHLRDNLQTLRKLNDYAVSVYKSGNQAVSGFDSTAINWDVIAWQSGAVFSTATSSAFAVNQVGIWELSGIAVTDAHASADLEFTLELEGTASGSFHGFWDMQSYKVVPAGNGRYPFYLCASLPEGQYWVNATPAQTASCIIQGGIGNSRAHWRLLGVST